MLSPAVDVSAMPDLMNHDDVLGVKNLIYNTVIADAQFIESCKVTCEWLGADFVQVSRKPTNTLDDSVSEWFV